MCESNESNCEACESQCGFPHFIRLASESAVWWKYVNACEQACCVRAGWKDGTSLVKWFLCCCSCFFLSLPFPLVRTYDCRRRASFHVQSHSLRVMFGKKSFLSETIDSASTYKCVPFFKCPSQSCVCHYSVRFMWFLFGTLTTSTSKLTVDLHWFNSFKFI